MLFRGLLFISLLLLVGCEQTLQFPEQRLDLVNKIIVYKQTRSSEGRVLINSISDKQQIAKLITFVNAHRSGFHAPPKVGLIPIVKAYFTNGPSDTGDWGLYENYFVWGWQIKEASADEAREYLSLIGITRDDYMKYRHEAGLSNKAP